MVRRNLLAAIFFGLAIIYGLVGVISFIFSLILKFTSLQESDFQLATTIISFIVLFIGGFIGGGKGKERGWLIGLAMGLLYTAINFSFQYLGHDSPVTFNQIIYYICFNLTIMMGAILGVNIAQNSSQRTS